MTAMRCRRARRAEVVRDEQIGEPQRLLQIQQQVEDLRLHGDVERGNRLVGDDQRRVQRQRAGDADPLALAAAELVRIPVEVRPGRARPAANRSATRSRRLRLRPSRWMTRVFDDRPRRIRGLSDE